METAAEILPRQADYKVKGLMMDYSKVVFFRPNRVWRVYCGGKLLDEFCGVRHGRDGSFPEDWLASTTRAVNGEHQQSEDEGLSFILGDGGAAGMSFPEFLMGNPLATLGAEKYDEQEGVGVLCKFLDSAIRLPIQCHPDIEFAKKHYNSSHGKAEAWMILNTREIDGEKPYLLMGFTPGVTAGEFAKAVETQNIAAMENMLHKVPVKAGDMFFIPGRFPHAIGPGVFLLEIQEPTDWVIQPERFIADIELTQADMWGPVSVDVGLECFDYTGEDMASTLAKVKLSPKELQAGSGGRLLEIMDEARSGCFLIRKLELCGEFVLPGGGYVGIVASGQVEMCDDKGRIYNARQGQSFFVPAEVREISYICSRASEVFITQSVSLKS